MPTGRSAIAQDECSSVMPEVGGGIGGDNQRALLLRPPGQFVQPLHEASWKRNEFHGIYQLAELARAGEDGRCVISERVRLLRWVTVRSVQPVWWRRSAWTFCRSRRPLTRRSRWPTSAESFLPC